jgi:hypothetical protein
VSKVRRPLRSEKTEHQHPLLANKIQRGIPLSSAVLFKLTSIGQATASPYKNRKRSSMMIFFEDTCEMMQNRNEAKIIQDIASLIGSRAQSVAPNISSA